MPQQLPKLSIIPKVPEIKKMPEGAVIGPYNPAVEIQKTKIGATTHNPLEYIQEFVRDYLPGVAKIADFVKQANELGGLSDFGNVNLGHAAVPFIRRKGYTEAEDFANFLQRAWPKLVDRSTADYNYIQDTKNRLFKDPQYKNNPIIQNFMNAIEEWVGGSTDVLRDPKILDEGSRRENIEELSDRLKMLLEASPNRTRQPLYRSTTLHELYPEILNNRYETNPNKLPIPKISDVFQSPLASYTANFRRMLGQDGPPTVILKLEPGANTLPIAGVSNFEKELEHIVGGKFQILDVMHENPAEPKNWYDRIKTPIISVRQVQPFVSPEVENPLFEEASKWPKFTGQLGSNPGGGYISPEGTKYYIKTYANPEQAKSEVLANKIYAQLGVNVPPTKLVTMGDKPAVATKWLEGAMPISPTAMANSNQIKRGFIADALLANHDVVGLSHDNIVNHNGVHFRIDNGGSMFFRGQGEPKAYFEKNSVPELLSMRDPNIARQAGPIFKDIHPVSISEQLIDLRSKLNPNIFKKLIKESGFQGEQAKKYLDVLNGRRETILRQSGMY